MQKGITLHMKKDTYQHMISFLRSRPSLAKSIVVGNSIVTKAIYIAYPCLLIYLFLQQYVMPSETLFSALINAPALVGAHLFLNYPSCSLFWQALLVPACSFILLSIFRKCINAPRPYEVFGTEPIIPKNTKGKSFPSRHVFSIFVIGTTFMLVCPVLALGIIILILGVVLAFLRVVSGVHFPRDVIAGALCGIMLALLGLLFV